MSAKRPYQPPVPKPLAEDRELWERQPNESQPAFEAFAKYRDQVSKRSIRRVAQELGKSATLMTRWSIEWQWVDRVKAYDAELDRKARDIRLEEIKRMNETHAKAATALITKALQRLKDMPLDEMRPSDVVNFIEKAAKLERLARGEPEAIIEERNKTEEKDYGAAIEQLISNPGFLAALQQAAKDPEKDNSSGGDAGPVD